MSEEPLVPQGVLACGAVTAPNLYVHFPFCRRKCTYCVLHSRCGVSEAARADYADALARTIRTLMDGRANGNPLSTVYFGGGSPALCDLRPLFKVLAPSLSPDTEFTVELHPLDVTEATLATLKAGGVNRISMGVQSLDDATLAAMGRGYTAGEAARAFARVKRFFNNAGIDLIVGYPGDSGNVSLSDWGFCHCSVYSLQLEEGSILARQIERGRGTVPSDEETLDRLRQVAESLESIGLQRYEISNYSRPGFECRHNLATWRGEDYLGLGEGAFGRLGRWRTRIRKGLSPQVEEVSAEADALERKIFALRTREGLDCGDSPQWMPILRRFADEGLVRQDGTRFVLTSRGTEICDTILAELV